MSGYQTIERRIRRIRRKAARRRERLIRHRPPGVSFDELMRKAA